MENRVIMKKRDPWGDRRFLILASLMLVFSSVITISRILLRERSETVTLLNDVAAVLSALTGTVLFLMVWFSTSNEDVSKKIWGKMVIGVVSWTVAEATWAYYEVIRGVDVPYPSSADLFWLFGYLIFYLALLAARSISPVSDDPQPSTKNSDRFAGDIVYTGSQHSGLETDCR